MHNITVYIDESGTVSKGTHKQEDFFIVTLLAVRDEDIKYVGKIFKKARLKVVNKRERLKNKLKINREIKGSELTEKQKQQIYEEACCKCGEKFQLGIIVFKNHEASVKFKSNSSRVFNYLIKLFLDKSFKSGELQKDVDAMHFIIDERNVATESRYTLEEYLNTELNLTDDFVSEDIHVRYHDSRNHLLLQFADFVSNTFYRKFQKKNETSDVNVSLLLQHTYKSKVFFFPPNNKKCVVTYNIRTAK